MVCRLGLTLVLALSSVACSSMPAASPVERDLVVVQVTAPPELLIDSARIEVAPPRGPAVSRTLAWPAPPETRLEVQLELEFIEASPPKNWEEYRARIGSNADPTAFQAFGLLNGTEVGLSDRSTQTLGSNATSGPVILNLAAHRP